MRRPKAPFKPAAPVQRDADAPVGARDPKDRTPYLMSIRQFSLMIGRDEDTISKWINKLECPVHSRGVGKGTTTLLDPRDVLRWREAYVQAEETAKHVKPGDAPLPAIPLKPAELLKMEQLKQARIKTALAIGLVVPRDEAGKAFDQCMGIIRMSVMSLPERLVRTMAGIPEDVKLECRKQSLASCRAALRAGASAIARAMNPDAEDLADDEDADGIDEMPEDDDGIFDVDDDEASE